MSRTCADVRAADAILHRPADRRAELERRDARRPTLGNCSASTFSSFALQPLARRHVLGDDDRLGEEVVGQLHVERQVEADRAAADIGAPARRRRDRSSSSASSRSATSSLAIDRGVLRQAADRPAAPAGRRAGRTAAARSGSARSDSDEAGRRVDADGEPARPHRADQQAAKARAGSRLGLPACFGLRLASGCATPSSGAKSTATNHDTISAMADHGEDREGVFAGRALRRSRSARSRRSVTKRAGQHRRRPACV